jgi:hypothetical protein
MKQTAVEWLYNNLKSHFEHDGDLLECVQMSMQQAKEMERANIIDAYLTNPLEAKWKNIGTDYYNETFNTNEK